MAKVFVTDYDYQADIKVFRTDNDYQADLLYHEEEYDYNAKGDEKWYFSCQKGR